MERRFLFQSLLAFYNKKEQLCLALSQNDFARPLGIYGLASI
jgi:hypothetical protein